MRFRTDKKQLRLMILLLTIVFISIELFSIFYVHKGVINPLSVAIPITYGALLCQILGDSTTCISMDEEALHYFRLGIDADIKWNEIEKIKFRGLTWLSPSHYMIIYTPLNKLQIDFVIKDYKKAWDYILVHYSKYNDNPLIDPKFKRVLKKKN